MAQVYRCPGFTFPVPATASQITEIANGQVYLVELRQESDRTQSPYLKLFTIPNPEGAINAATLFSLGAQELVSLSAKWRLEGGEITEGIQDSSLGPVACRSQEFHQIDGAVVGHGRVVILQTTPMAAGAILWTDPGVPEALFMDAERLLTGIKILTFTEDTLRPMEREGIEFAVPLLWTRQEQSNEAGSAMSCQGAKGSLFISVGASGLFGGALGESFLLDAQPGEANTVAANLGGSVLRRNALMRLVGEQLHVGQRYLLQVPGGPKAELRLAVFSNPGTKLALVSALYLLEHRAAMLAIMDQVLSSMTLPQQRLQQMEILSWSGISVGFPERMSVETRIPTAFLPGGWVFTIQHDSRPEDRSFQARIWREDAPDQAADAATELLASVNELVTLWPGAKIENPESGQDKAFGQPAAVLKTTLIVDGLALVVDARRVVTEHGIYRSLAYFPADLQDDHLPALNFILDHSKLWEDTAPVTTTSGAKIRLLDASWRLRDFHKDGHRAFSVSNERGVAITCAPDFDLTPEHDLVEYLGQDYFMGDEVVARPELTLSGRKLPAVQTSFIHDEEGRELDSLEFHTFFVADGVVWNLTASGLEADRPLIIAALAGIELAPR